MRISRSKRVASVRHTPTSPNRHAFRPRPSAASVKNHSAGPSAPGIHPGGAKTTGADVRPSRARRDRYRLTKDQSGIRLSRKALRGNDETGGTGGRGGGIISRVYRRSIFFFCVAHVINLMAANKLSERGNIWRMSGYSCKLFTLGRPRGMAGKIYIKYVRGVW